VPTRRTSSAGTISARTPPGATSSPASFYGFRTAILFAAAFTALTYLIGVSLGCAMGYFGGLFDLLFQRLIEIWSNIPFLYMVIIVFSVIPTAPSADVDPHRAFCCSSWCCSAGRDMTYYMRTETYREKARDYTAAALVLGAGSGAHHLPPHPAEHHLHHGDLRAVHGVAAITAITALDFLGWGLPPPTPSIGELLKQGTANLTTAPWIVTSAFAALVFILDRRHLHRRGGARSVRSPAIHVLPLTRTDGDPICTTPTPPTA
jgi:microcin C transport system permease protein